MVLRLGELREPLSLSILIRVLSFFLHESLLKAVSAESWIKMELNVFPRSQHKEWSSSWAKIFPDYMTKKITWLQETEAWVTCPEGMLLNQFLVNEVKNIIKNQKDFLLHQIYDCSNKLNKFISSNLHIGE